MVKTCHGGSWNSMADSCLEEQYEAQGEQTLAEHRLH